MRYGIVKCSVLTVTLYGRAYNPNGTKLWYNELLVRDDVSWSIFTFLPSLCPVSHVGTHQRVASPAKISRKLLSDVVCDVADARR